MLHAYPRCFQIQKYQVQCFSKPGKHRIFYIKCLLSGNHTGNMLHAYPRCFQIQKYQVQWFPKPGKHGIFYIKCLLSGNHTGNMLHAYPRCFQIQKYQVQWFPKPGKHGISKIFVVRKSHRNHASYVSRYRERAILTIIQATIYIYRCQH